VAEDDLTLPAGPGNSGPTRSVTPFTPRTPASGAGRFTPGAIIAGRYRLVALLGRGGMGEVYRAEDLTLDQPVALKFLPQGIAADAPHLAQFHNELRIARQVSHKNVCRLYDLGEADGRRFLTMEYVDGEDLGSLLRRIGRFPQDRALAIARQLCAGVAAAHEKGVIHRDLKPANVMIDGDGNVRITDFGIATAEADAGGEFAGTPQYMAPEQLHGRGASVKSDLYSLGLVLFETFTGKRAHDAKTLGELKALHDSGSVTTPSSVVHDLDPAIERVIMRCLDRDPAKRPASALTVAAALPGGDPLAAALAAGETPSPEMLAAAGESQALPVGRGLLMVAAVAAGVMTVAALSPRVSIPGRVPLDKPPAVLADRAQQIVRSLGYTDRIVDAASDFMFAEEYIRWIADHDQSPQRWETLRAGTPAAVEFWYRTSPRLLVAGRQQLSVTPADPPLTVSGMTLVVLDTEGRLQEFHAVPPQLDPSEAPAPATNWAPLFDAAGLQMSNFSSATPQWTPRDYADSRAAWEGRLGDAHDINVRVEAAAYRGRAVSFRIVGPWSRATRQTGVAARSAASVLVAVAGLVLVGCVIAALMLARFNLRSKRADSRGATRLAIFVMIGYAIVWAISAHHVPDVNQEINGFSRNFGNVLMAAALLWVVYVALEPYVRRFWPDGILGWTRLISGYVRDPRVGRDVLIGCLFGTVLTLLEVFYIAVPPALGAPAPIPRFQDNVTTLNGFGGLIGSMFDYMVSGLFVAMFSVLGFVLLRLLLRRTGFAIVGYLIVVALFQASQVITSGTSMWAAALFQLSIIVTLTFMLVRFGLLVTAVAFAISALLEDVPMRLSVSHWTALSTNIAIALALGAAAWGFYASRAGQPLFGKWEA